ncbi:MAG: DUF456 domain-containing protein [Deltaproteobacteria bacterium]|nr:DUF456 domain-containing protein [Deltaproteobacteria bacterium]TLN04424.1 MAG: DUF456 domain-containing protein [bacterium]
MIIFLWILAALLVLVGIAGTVLPILPGVPLVFFGLVTAAWIDDFQRVGWGVLAFLAVVTVLSQLIDLLATARGAQKMGAGRAALLGGTVGLVVGLFFGLPGLILGPFLGAFLGEYLAKGNLRQSGKAGFGTWLGLLCGVVLKVVVIVAMLGIFITAYFL